MNSPRVPSNDPVLRKAEDARSKSRREFRQRLGIYLLGVAIGLMMVGMIWQARRNAMIRAGVDPNQSVFPAEPGTVPQPSAPKSK